MFYRSLFKVVNFGGVTFVAVTTTITFWNELFGEKNGFRKQE
jgi:hypothetical protein